jgi:long-chain acyl-CoA synthetase
MEKIWLKKYPQKVNHTVNVEQYNSAYEVYSEAIKKFGTKPAFTNLGKTLSFSELDSKVEQFASFLQHELRLKKGDRIAIQMPNLLQYPVILFAAMKTGLIVVNTNPLYTATEMKHQFKDSGVKAIVILANYAHTLEQIIKETQIESVVITEVGDLLPFPKNLIVNSVIKYIKKMVPTYNIAQAYTFNQALQLGSARPSSVVACKREEIAFLQYTGGTTGVSKGAILLHKNIIANMLQIFEWMKPLLHEGQEKIITALPLYHIFSLTVNCMALMRFGAENILITNPRDIPGFIKELKKHKFTIVAGVNTLFNALMNNPEFKTVDFSNLKISVAGAMALQKAVALRWKEVTQSLVVEGFGLTEASPVLTCNPIDGNDIVGTVGLPLPSTEVKLVDDDGKEIKNIGDSGELCARGPQIMQGYWQRDDETKKVIDSDGWLKTGDIATVDENGYFKIVDRKKDMIIVSGFNVYPNEIEDVIAALPGVLEVAAVGVADEHSGEIVKAVVVKRDPLLTEKDVIECAKKSLTAYKVPKIVEFRTELPKTNVGKILRRALRA